MKANEVAEKILQHFINYEYKLHNVYIFQDWECDFFCMSTSGYYVETEIKISRGDFFNDFNKSKHQLFKALHQKKKFIVERKGAGRGDYMFRIELGSLVDNTKTKWYRHQDLSQIKRYDITYQAKYIYAPCSHIKIIDFENVNLPHQFYFAVPTGLVEPHEIPSYAGLIYIEQGYAKIIKKAPYMHKRKMDMQSILLRKFYHLWKFTGSNLHNELKWLKKENKRLLELFEKHNYDKSP